MADAEKMYGSIQISVEGIEDELYREQVLDAARQALLDAALREQRRVREGTLRLRLLTERELSAATRDELARKGVEVHLPYEGLGRNSPYAMLVATGETTLVEG